MPDSVFPPLDSPQAVSSMSEGRAVTPPVIDVTGLGSGRAGLESHVHPSQLQGLGPSWRPSESAPHPEPMTGGPVLSLLSSLPDSEASSSERLSPLSPPSSVCYSVGSEALPRHPRPGFSPPWGSKRQAFESPLSLGSFEFDALDSPPCPTCKPGPFGANEPTTHSNTQAKRQASGSVCLGGKRENAEAVSASGLLRDSCGCTN